MVAKTVRFIGAVEKTKKKKADAPKVASPMDMMQRASAAVETAMKEMHELDEVLHKGKAMMEGSRLVTAAKEAATVAAMLRDVQRHLERLQDGDERTQCERWEDAMSDAAGHFFGAGDELNRAVEALNTCCDDDGWVNVGQKWVNLDDLELMAQDLDGYGMQSMYNSANADEYDDDTDDIDWDEYERALFGDQEVEQPSDY